MKAYEVYVPLNLNDGTDAADTVAALEELALELFGGYTAGAETVGVWRSPEGAVYRDRVRVYTLFAERAEDVITFAGEVGTALAQEAVSVVMPDRTAYLHLID